MFSINYINIAPALVVELHSLRGIFFYLFKFSVVHCRRDSSLYILCWLHYVRARVPKFSSEDLYFYQKELGIENVNNSWEVVMTNFRIP